MSATPDMIDAAFRAILAGNASPEARRLISDVQRAEYGSREWRWPIPTRDATDQAIVFQNASGWRYSVHETREDGAHVRWIQPGAGPPRRFEARGPTASAAREVAAAFLGRFKFHEARRFASEATLDGVALLYHYGRSLD